MTGKEILMTVGDYGEDYEMMVPCQTLEAVDHEIDAVCPEKSGDDIVKTAIHDFRGDQTYQESRGHDFELTASFDDVNPADYDGLVLPGGREPEYLRTYKEVLDVIRHFAADDKPIAAICHAAQILAAADVLSGRTCTAYPALKYDVEAAGGSWVDHVAVDENLVTAQSWADHPEWFAAFLDVLGTRIEHVEQEAAAGGSDN